MLLKVADAYDVQVDRRIQALFKIIEPLLLILMAVVVGFIVIALFVPLDGDHGADRAVKRASCQTGARMTPQWAESGCEALAAHARASDAGDDQRARRGGDARFRRAAIGAQLADEPRASTSAMR